MPAFISIAPIPSSEDALRFEEQAERFVEQYQQLDPLYIAPDDRVRIG